ncbi:hypothetical protein [Algicola sagamiensis]|uniref:hypothetical protein n=1 Tax=Algicola sagamiensis TaxID=163869 RepID=UPI00036EA490|nr:hypothetical protein [Algicola sagamiensis]
MLYFRDLSSFLLLGCIGCQPQLPTHLEGHWQPDIKQTRASLEVRLASWEEQRHFIEDIGLGQQHLTFMPQGLKVYFAGEDLQTIPWSHYQVQSISMSDIWLEVKHPWDLHSEIWHIHHTRTEPCLYIQKDTWHIKEYYCRIDNKRELSVAKNKPFSFRF